MKDIEIDLSNEGSQLVVEGYIQQGFPAYVFITKSEGYFNPVDSNTLNNISVDNAQVFVEREDGVIHQLTYIDRHLLDSLGLSDTLSLPLKALYVDLSYQKNNFSQIGYEYKLIIEWNNESLSAITSIPPQYPVDSVWVKRKDSLESDYKCYIWARINDPDTLGNSAIIHYKRDVGWKPMDPLFIACAIPVRTDNIVNGENFEAFFANLVDLAMRMSSFAFFMQIGLLMVNLLEKILFCLDYLMLIKEHTSSGEVLKTCKMQVEIHFQNL